ncbi:energy-coupling factor transporter transmembrane component T [Neobacillus sp. 179-C4.2 HS]|uniref:Energy-coupling factor transporter transmembrane component T n=1 Tax=Neobacillus driksii TaxID=3035913 RepID=A0ABV4YWY4_9BACI|nr:energy-coupling factor transporter transmembrane component T [Neobacillus sp. 179.-C4.2 HS]MDP5195888.1 energy-coupling factor transporter transmembrane component T [Neobacillus sp. 179.-C4.2 HS]
MNHKILSYIHHESPIHRLTGAAKLIGFILWSLIAMITYDTRILVVMFILGIMIFLSSKVEFRYISFVFYIFLLFLFINNIAIFLFEPMQGVEMYHTKHEILHIIAHYTLTAEQLFYQFNLTLKYLTIIPLALLFMVTTHPSEFAASLNKIGVSYRIAYAVALALRYIPDIQRDYQNISLAQQARGIDLSKKQKLTKKLRYASSILMPLIFSSLNRIETISAAIELRGFGSQKRRSWYHERPFTKADYFAIILIVLLFVFSMIITFLDGNRFYNPFR